METVLSGLKQFTRYEVTVRAFNQVGPGPSSDPVIASTIEGGRRNLTRNFKFRRF